MTASFFHIKEALSVGQYRAESTIALIFDDPNLVANAGLLLVATLVRDLGFEDLCGKTIGLIHIGPLRPQLNLHRVKGLRWLGPTLSSGLGRVLGA